jgi:membrane-bound serine protease (ClpP class)
VSARAAAAAGCVAIALVALLQVSTAVAAAATQPARPVVFEIPLTGAVDPLVARMTERGLRDARRAHAAAVVVRIDTPGGLDSSMRSIIESIQRSPVPVVCWVGPSGARAASAGTFVLVGCPVAAMAPSTNVGAAHPVGITGQVLATKVTNDAAAYIRSLAQAHGRDADWAERAVRNSVSISADDAVRLHVADLLAPSRAALLRAVDGRPVTTARGTVTLDTAGATVHTVHLTWGESILHLLDDPNIAFVLFVAGIALLVLALIHHGVQVYGVVGLVLVLSSLVVFSVLPVNLAGIILLVAAFVLFVLDVKLHAHGAPVVAGLVAFVFGGLYLYNGSVRVSRPLVFGLAVAFAALFFLAVRAAVRAHRAPLRVGGSIVGAEGVVVRDLAPEGVVRINREEWSARVAMDGPDAVPAGATVRVVGTAGLTVEVVPSGSEGVSKSDAPGAEVTS